MTNKELLKENAFLKQRIQELEQSESERKQVKKTFRFLGELFNPDGFGFWNIVMAA